MLALPRLRCNLLRQFLSAARARGCCLQPESGGILRLVPVPAGGRIRGGSRPGLCCAADGRGSVALHYFLFAWCRVFTDKPSQLLVCTIFGFIAYERCLPINPRCFARNCQGATRVRTCFIHASRSSAVFARMTNLTFELRRLRHGPCNFPRMMSAGPSSSSTGRTASFTAAHYTVLYRRLSTSELLERKSSKERGLSSPVLASFQRMRFEMALRTVCSSPRTPRVKMRMRASGNARLCRGHGGKGCETAEKSRGSSTSKVDEDTPTTRHTTHCEPRPHARRSQMHSRYRPHIPRKPRRARPTARCCTHSQRMRASRRPRAHHNDDNRSRPAAPRAAVRD